MRLYLQWRTGEGAAGGRKWWGEGAAGERRSRTMRLYLRSVAGSAKYRYLLRADEALALDRNQMGLNRGRDRAQKKDRQ